MNITGSFEEQISKQEAEWQTKCDAIATNINRVFPTMKITFKIWGGQIGGHTLEIGGLDCIKGYRFNIRIKIDDFEKQPAKAIAEAYTDKLTQCQKEKDHDRRIERK